MSTLRGRVVTEGPERAPVRARLRAVGLALAAGLPQAPDVPVVRVTAEIVHVEVLVSDKRGEPVVGLGRDDFVLYEDGKPVQIVAFDAPEAVAAPAAGQPAPPAQPAAAPLRRETTTLVVYLDSPDLTPGGLRRSLDHLPQLLEAQLATDGVRALVLAESAGTRALTGVTTDRAALNRAVAEARDLPVQGHRVASDERTALESIRAILESTPGSCAEVLPLMQSVVRQYADGQRLRIRDTVIRLGNVAAALGTLPGSKALLFMSEGLEQRPGAALFHQLGDICPEVMHSAYSQVIGPIAEYDLSRELKEAAARASAARVTIYPLDAAGLRPPGVADASHSDRRYVPSTATESVREANVRAGAWILAEETGGTPVFASNAPVTALGGLSDEIRGRYALGFSPARAADGRTHTLRVEVRRKGLSVRHRLSYRHADSGDLQFTRTLAALLLDYEQDTLDAGIAAEIAPGGDDDAAKQVRVRVSVPLARLATREGDGGRLARLQVVIVVRRAGGALTEQASVGRQRLIELRLPPRPPEGDDPAARHEIVVNMPHAPGEQDIAVGVRDVLGGGASYKRLRIGAR